MNKHNSDVKKILLFGNEFRELCEKTAGQEIRAYTLLSCVLMKKPLPRKGRRTCKRHPHECLKGMINSRGKIVKGKTYSLFGKRIKT